MLFADAVPHIWKDKGFIWSNQGFLVHPFNEIIIDPLEDLNVIHEAEKIIIIAGGITKAFGGHLYDVINQEPVKDTGCEYDGLVSGEEVAALRIHATASQRLEAILRTIGKWNDS